jgi:hypothetical protein
MKEIIHRGISRVLPRIFLSSPKRPLMSFNQCCGSGIRCLFDPWTLIYSRSRISNPYFWELSDKFLGKKFYNSLKTGRKNFLQHFKNNIIFNFVKFVATKKGRTTNFVFTPLFCCCFCIRDPGYGMGKNQDPG